MDNCRKDEKKEVVSGRDIIEEEKKVGWLILDGVQILIGVFLLFEIGYNLLFVSEEAGLYVAFFALAWLVGTTLFERYLKKAGK